MAGSRHARDGTVLCCVEADANSGVAPEVRGRIKLGSAPGAMRSHSCQVSRVRLIRFKIG